MQQRYLNNSRVSVAKRWLLLWGFFNFFCYQTPVINQYLEPQHALTQYNLDIWTTDEGLPSNSVLEVLQTSDGYLWLGTYNGLARFDGVEFSVFSQANTHALKSNGIWTLAEDKEGVLWIGTNGGGLAQYKNQAFKSYQTKDGLPGEIVKSLHVDAAGQLWIGTDKGLCVREGERFRKIEAPEVADIQIDAIISDAGGNLWIGTNGKGLVKFRNGKYTAIKSAADKEIKFVHSLERMPDSSIWVGTKAGLFQVRKDEFTVYTTEEGLPNESINALHVDPVGTLWIGTDDGLVRRTGNKFDIYPHGNGFLSNKIDHIITDMEGNLWIATYRGGLMRLKQGKFITFGTSEGLSHNVVNAIVQSADGKIWVGTDEGLNKLDETNAVSAEKIAAVQKERVRGLCAGKDGSVWAATYKGLYHMLPDGKTKLLTEADGLCNNYTRCVFEASDGALWIGTRNGLNRYFQGQFTTFTRKEGLTNDFILSINQGKNGELLIGTDGGGLNIYNSSTGKFKGITTKEGLPANIIFSVYEDSAGTRWICSNGGLTRISAGNMTTYSARNGLGSDAIFQMLEDKQGFCWMTSNDGVIRIEKKQLEDYAEGRIERLRSLLYGKNDGMKTNECTGTSLGCQDRRGRLWFPTLHGVAKIDPARIKMNVKPPPVVLERLIVDSLPILIKDYLQLEAGSKKIEFHYAGLSYVSSEQVKFRYQLVGFDEKWVEAGTQRKAFYTNLAPGDYIFRVIACNNDGFWNDKGFSIAFHLKPHFYQTWWFYVLVSVLSVAGGYAFYRWRVAALERAKRKLEAIVAERTREVMEQKALIEQKNIILQDANNQIQQKNAELANAFEEIRAQNEQLQQANAEIIKQRDEIAEQNHEIHQSIMYAKRIQHAFLPDDIEIQQFLPEYFILYKPQHIVSGDFYWFSAHEDHLIVAAVDCTGHGVPGAFMSMMGNSLFHQAINERGIHDPVKLLYELDDMIRRALKQSDPTSESNDGMDMAVCSYYLRQRRMEYAGANRPLWIVRNGVLEEIKPDKFGLGGRQFVGQKKFTKHEIQIYPGDTFYIFSDGYADQIGGPNQKKFMTKQFKELLLKINAFSMQEQSNMLDYTITQWTGNNIQLDDMLVIGTRFNWIPEL
jgi:ligand-binding sensor domain-containing protein/serine phosphatase RsbU (regulator of sigma subunit)